MWHSIFKGIRQPLHIQAVGGCLCALHCIQPLHMAHDRLARWLERRPRGALNALAYRTGLALNTVRKARTEPVDIRAALLISQETGWEVPVSELTDDAAALNAISEMPARLRRSA